MIMIKPLTAVLGLALSPGKTAQIALEDKERPGLLPCPAFRRGPFARVSAARCQRQGRVTM